MNGGANNTFVDLLKLSFIRNLLTDKSPVILSKDRKVFTCIFWDTDRDVYMVTDIVGNRVRVESFLNRILSEVRENRYSDIDFIAGNVDKVYHYLTEKSKRLPYRYHVGVCLDEYLGTIEVYRTLNEYTQDNIINVIKDEDYSPMMKE